MNQKFKVIDDDTVEVPAGTYWLGDPCYAIEDGWERFLDEGIFAGGPIGPLGKNGEALAFGTAYGDGCYEGSDGNHYAVDAGLIGLVPVKHAEKTPNDKLSKKVTFTEPTLCTNRNGLMKFGSITIDTLQEEDTEE